jgi:outer membrane biosynthesis protein TonB
VQVSVTIGTDGVPREASVTGDPNLVPAALDAIRRWRYVPAVLDGRAVESHTVIAITFPPKS